MHSADMMRPLMCTAAAVLVFTGCAKGDFTTSPSATPTASSATPTPVPSSAQPTASLTPYPASVTVTITAAAGTSADILVENNACAGAGKLADLRPGTRVVLLDATHHTVASGKLSTSYVVDDLTCSFTATLAATRS